jgi:protein-S-isoprenylcysteine O-methyltransferase Ste14
LAILSIGVFVLAITIVATVFLARSSAARAGLAGIVSGIGVPLLYVAFLNRSGPGVVCTGRSCTDEWSPWPWLLIGAALLLVGLAWFIATSGRRARHQSVALD